MIEAAERDGKLRPGGTLVEATAGNTGLGLALVAAHKGYRLILVIPDKMSQEKIFHLRALGAEVRMTRSDVGKGHPEYYQDMAERIARETPARFYINQFGNPANPLAHETTTGAGDLGADGARGSTRWCAASARAGRSPASARFFAARRAGRRDGARRSGRLGAGRVREDRDASARPGSWLVEGIGEDFVPSIADLSRVKQGLHDHRRGELHTARELLRQEGILGRLVVAARCSRRRCATAASRRRPSAS